MKKAERLIYHLDLSILAKSRTFDAPRTISVRRAFQLMELIPKGQRIKNISKGREALYISDWSHEDSIICILVNKSDKTLSDPVFTNPTKSKRRTAEKQEDEGQDFSSHIVVKLPSDDLLPATVLIEHCPGLGIHVVERLFNQLLHDAKTYSPSDFKQNHPDGALGDDGKQKQYNVAFKCDFAGHISDELKHDLNNGKIHSVELITEKERHSNLDEHGYLVEKCKTLELTVVDENRTLKDIYTYLKSYFATRKADYSRARIRFKSSSGIERTIEMETSDASALGYVKRDILNGFEFELKSSYEAFHDPILERMKGLLPPGE